MADCLKKKTRLPSNFLGGLIGHPTPELIALAVISCVKKENYGQNIGFYGCGNVAKLLLDAHYEELRAYHIFFIESRPTSNRFHDYPLVGPRDIRIQNASKIFILSSLYSEVMLAELKGVEPKSVCTVAKAVSMLPADISKRFYFTTNSERRYQHIKKINRLIDNGRPTIFYALPGVVNEALKLMYFIRKNGWNLVLFTASDKVNGMPLIPYEDFGYFDYLVIAEAYCLELQFIARKTKASLIHFDVGVGLGLPVADTILYSTLPVFIRYLDIKEAVFWGDEDRWRRHCGKELYPYERDAAEIIFTQSHGLIYKDSPKIIDTLEKLYNHKPRRLYFPSYPSNTFSCSGTNLPKYSQLDGHTHLVYCGLLFNQPNDKLRLFFQSILEAARTLATQNIHLTVYNGLDSGNSGYQEYKRLSEEIDQFHYQGAKRPDEIGRIMSRYDFAFFCFDQSKNPDSQLYQQTTFGSKIFAFIEAGLPIIVSLETSFMAQFVVENHIGIAIPWQDLRQLSKIIKRTDWAPIRHCLDLKRREWQMEKKIEDLFDFYLDAVTLNKINPTT